MRTSWLGKVPLVIFYAVPWAFLVCLAIFVAAVALKVGHFPTYSQPDPKHVGGLSSLYLLTMILSLLTILSPIVVGVHYAWARFAGRDHIGGWSAAFYVLGVALSAFIVVGDAFKLRTWLLD
jgi:hypothetical protein